MWIIGDFHAVRLHPLVLSPTTLYVRTGLRWRVELARTQIAAVGRATPRRLPRQQVLNAAVYGAVSPPRAQAGGSVQAAGDGEA